MLAMQRISILYSWEVQSHCIQCDGSGLCDPGKDPRGCSVCSNEKCEDTGRMGSIKVTAYNATDLVSASTGKILGVMRCARMKIAKDADCGG